MELSVCLFWLSFLFRVQADQLDDQRAPLHLLNILPYPDCSPDSGWDKAYELIPAAQLAVEKINSKPHILPGYELHLVNVESEPCGSSLITDGLVNTYNEVFNSSLNVVGLVGLFCSTVTDTIASIFGKNSFTYLQLAGSTSPKHRDNSTFPWLVHLISSSTVFNEAFFSLAVKSKWKRVGTIYNALSALHGANAANMKVHAEESDITISESIPTTGNTDVHRVFSILTDSRIRIMYVSALASDSANIVCEAHRRNTVYPGYVFIFPERSLDSLQSMAKETNCTSDQITKALEGAVFMRYRLATNNTKLLVSETTYKDYNKKYRERLMDMVRELDTCKNISLDNDYANVMHDQIWAFSLALNKLLHEENINLTNLQLHQREDFAGIMRRKFRNVSFEGASGSVSFNMGMHMEESSVVDIYQVIDGNETLLGDFNQDSNKTLRLFFNYTISNISDSFENRTLLLPLWESILFNSVFLVFIAVTTFVLIFLLVFRSRPEVKASSPSLSFAMIVGCYLTFVSALVRNIHKGFPITNYYVFTVLCNVQAWLWMIGLTLLFSALLLRLLRINHFFHAYGKVSPYWKDRYLVLCMLVICCGGILILTVWTIVDKAEMVTTLSYQPNTNPPFFEVKVECSCKTQSLWLFLTLSYNGIFMVVIVLLAVQTRKIRLSNYKNTKQINAFIILTCMTLGLIVPLHYVIGIERYGSFSHFIVTFAFSCTGVYCQLFIFLPQVFTVMKNIIFRKSHRIRLRKESQFSRSHIPSYAF